MIFNNKTSYIAIEVDPLILLNRQAYLVINDVSNTNSVTSRNISLGDFRNFSNYAPFKLSADKKYIILHRNNRNAAEIYKIDTL